MSRFSEGRCSVGVLAFAAFLPLCCFAQFAKPSAAGPMAERLAELRLSSQQLSFSKVAGYDKVELSGAELRVRTGEPVIPVRYMRLALPIGYEAVEVRVDAGEPQSLPGRYRLLPGTDPVPVSAPPQNRRPVEGSAYRSNAPYPGTLAELLGTGCKSGYPIADVAVYPLQYAPASGRLTLYPELRVTVVARPNPAQETVTVRSEWAESVIRDAVAKLVDNPADVPTSAAYMNVSAANDVGIASTDTVEYLIVTSSGLKTIFDQIADWKTKKGVRTKVLDLSWIYANYTGEQARDNQDKIRHCIKDHWQNKGTIYVLLGGDVNVVPYRPAFAMAENNGNDIPCDLYFSDLNGTWNADGDAFFGEHPSDNVDMYADVYVGRAPVWTNMEAQTFVTKVLQYEGEPWQAPLPTDYQLKVLFLASRLDANTDSAALKNTIQSESVPTRFTCTKLYESSGNLNRIAALNAINTGFNLINHSGHGSDDVIQSGADYISGGDMYNRSNAPRYSAILYSLSCYSGNFPTNDCIAEKFVLAPSGGGFYIGNSRYGWYYGGNPTSGLSLTFDRYFWRAMLASGFNFYPLGQAHGEGKDLGVGAARFSPYDRFCLYELNLFGDPELPIWKNTPQALQVAHASQILPGQNFIVTVTSGGTPVRDVTVCLWKDPDVYLTAKTNAYGQITFPPLSAAPGEVCITATKYDYLPVESSAYLVPSSLYGFVTLEQLTPSPGGILVTVEFRTPGTTNVVRRYDTVLQWNGRYDVYECLSGTFDLSLKYSNWLRRTLPSVTVGANTRADFLLKNGDADGNNAVDIGDLNSVLSRFGGSGLGDLDRDGVVSITDLNIVLTNFGLTGNW